jgi:hypothetical protein
MGYRTETAARVAGLLTASLEATALGTAVSAVRGALTGNVANLSTLVALSTATGTALIPALLAGSRLVGALAGEMAYPYVSAKFIDQTDRSNVPGWPHL